LKSQLGVFVESHATHTVRPKEEGGRKRGRNTIHLGRRICGRKKKISS